MSRIDSNQFIYRGIKWTSVQQWTQFLIQAATTIILSNILSPNDFGLYIAASIPIGLMIVLQEIGLGSVIIRKKSLTDTHISTYLIVLVCLAMILFMLTYTLAPYYVSLYDYGEINNKLITDIVRVLSITIVLTSLSIIPQSMLQRKLDFRRLSFNYIISILLSSIISIAIAAKIGVWSLVLKQVSMISFLLLFNWAASSVRINLSFNYIYIQNELVYIREISVSQVMIYLSRNLDYLIIGRFLGADSLGQYSIAYKLMVFPLRSLSSIMTKILFPILNKMMPDLHSVRTQYVESIRLIALFTFPVMFIIAGASDVIVNIFFDRYVWDQLATLILITGLLGAIQSTTSPVGVLYKLQNKASSLSLVTMLGVVTNTGAFLIGAQWGLVQAVLLYSVLWVLILFPIPNIVIFNKLGISFISFLAVLQIPLFISAILFGILRYITPYIIDMSAVGFILLFLINISAYGLVLLLFKINLYRLIKLIFRA